MPSIQTLDTAGSRVPPVSNTTIFGLSIAFSPTKSIYSEPVIPKTDKIVFSL